MKKSSSKKPRGKRTYSLDDGHRPFKVELSRGEICELANQHIRQAKKIPTLFGKWIAANPKATASQLKLAKERMLEICDWHHDRASELLGIFDAES